MRLTLETRFILAKSNLPYRLTGWHEGYYSFAYCLRPTRHFLPGDVVGIFFCNGQAERWEAFGYSSKHRNIMRGLYVQCQRWKDGRKPIISTLHLNKVPFRLFVPPNGTSRIHENDFSGVRAWLASLDRTCSVSRIPG
jgi:hypothetical protein